MDFFSASYLGAITVAAWAARTLRPFLPAHVRARLWAAGPPDPAPGWVWLHAVSVGELLLARGVLGKLLEGGHSVHVTAGTGAGLALLSERLPSWDGGACRLTGGPFPIDDPKGLRGFFTKPPGAFVALETEIWPNLFRKLKALGIPICIVNGRLTGRTSKSLFRPWLRRALSMADLVAARDAASAEIFREMGATNVRVGGNLKADLPSPPPLHAGWGAVRAGWMGMPIIVAGNTIEGEEGLLIDAFAHALRAFPDLRLIVAPRQPKRFGEAAALLRGAGIVYARASGAWPKDPAEWREVRALLLDTLGELASAYSLGNAALVGGGWCGKGGHNPMEPLHWGLPTLIGPGFGNFVDLVHPLLEAGCLRVVEAGALADSIVGLLANTEEGRGPTALPEALRGSLEKTWTHLLPHLPKP